MDAKKIKYYGKNHIIFLNNYLFVHSLHIVLEKEKELLSVIVLVYNVVKI